MQNYSTTQATNLVSLAGVIAMILAYCKIGINTDEVQLFLGATVTIIGLAHNWYNRYKQGDITVAGFRKN